MTEVSTKVVADRILRHMSERGCTAEAALRILIANGEAGRVRKISEGVLAAMEAICNDMGL